MANLSDAFGTVRVDGVGKEFLEFLDAVQGTEEKAYYKLVDIEDYREVEPDEKNNLEFKFQTFGRWSYGANLEGYLRGEWMNGESRGAWEKLIDALRDSGGFIEVDYKDSDTAMDWMGDGVAVLRVSSEYGGDIEFHDSFESENITLEKYAEQQGFTEYEALEYVYGDEVADKYKEYCDAEEAKGNTPAKPDTWYESIYEDE